MGIRSKVINSVIPDVHRVAPNLNSGFIHSTLSRAIRGVGPLPSADKVASNHLDEAEGNVDKAITSVARNHAALAGGEGFLANIGGLTTAPATVPANIAGLALLQCRMVAAIASLRGYDLQDQRVRNAVLLCMLGEDAVAALVKRRSVPGRPAVLATAPVHDPEVDRLVAGEVTNAIVSRVVGKRAAGIVVRRIPLAGGVWGGSADAWATWQIGRYAAKELTRRG